MKKRELIDRLELLDASDDTEIMVIWYGKPFSLADDPEAAVIQENPYDTSKKVIMIHEV